MNHSTRKNGRHDLPTGNGRIGELTLPTEQQPIDLASLPSYVVIVIDGIRFDSKKVLEQLTDRVTVSITQASAHTESLTYVNATSLVGKRTISLEELAVNGKIYMGDMCYDVELTERELMGQAHRLRPEPTPVDLGSLPAETIIQVDNAKIKAGKLYKLLAKTESKGQIAPVTPPKFKRSVIDTAKDRGIDGQISIDDLTVDDIYWFNGREFSGDDIERLIDLNLRKLDPRSPYTHLTDSVKASWQGFKAEAKATHKKYPKLTTAILVIIAGYMLFDTIHDVGTPSNIATLNLLHFLQDPANGFTAYNEILKGVSLYKQFVTINLAFMAIGGWLGYRNFSGSSKYSGTIGMIIGIFVSRVVQFLVVAVIAGMLH